MSAANAGGNSYPYGTISTSYILWTAARLTGATSAGRAGVSTELSGGSFLPAFNCIDNPGCGDAQGIWPENRGVLIYRPRSPAPPISVARAGRQ